MAGTYRYWILSMIMFMMMINFIDRGAISYAQAAIISEFQLDVQSWGQVLGFFGYGYMVGGLLGGLLSDLKGPKYVWVLAGAGWSIFAIATAFAGDIGVALFSGSALAGFAVIRIMFGLFEAPVFSANNRIIANWVAPAERGFCSSLLLVGPPIGSLLTAPISVALLYFFDWRMMFVILGVIGLIWVFFFNRMFTNRPEDHPKVSAAELQAIRTREGLLATEVTLEESEKKKATFLDFFKNPTLLCNTISFFAFQYVNFMLLLWTPKYLQDVYHFELSSLWYLGMIPWIGPCFTVLLGGKISDYLRKKTGSLRIARPGVIITSLLLTSICFLLIPTVDSVAMVMLLIAVGNSFNFITNSIFWTIIVDTEPAKVGTFSGITHFIVNIATVTAPVLTGSLVALYGYSAMFLGAAVAAFVGVVAMIFVKPGRQTPVTPGHNPSV
ncbi:MFS transporter [Brevibacillus sp. TJ4]|uniref:MFS transporter n=1 Tax=Brevibacillus sp. TJ4 TaxID=3234853 RepID=UPI0037D315DA